MPERIKKLIKFCSLLLYKNLKKEYEICAKVSRNIPPDTSGEPKNLKTNHNGLSLSVGRNFSGNLKALWNNSGLKNGTENRTGIGV